MSRELDERVARARGWHWDDDWGCLIPPEQKAKPGEMWTGWHRDHDGDDLHRQPVPGAAINRIVYNGDMSKIILPEYSTDIAAAWQVVEWMITGKPWECYLTHQTDGWDCDFSHPGAMGVMAQTAPTAPEAICLAFLAAIEANHS